MNIHSIESVAQNVMVSLKVVALLPGGTKQKIKQHNYILQFTFRTITNVYIPHFESTSVQFPVGRQSII